MLTSHVSIHRTVAAISRCGVAGRYRADVPADLPYQVTVDSAVNGVRLVLSGEIDIAMNDHLGDAVDKTFADRPDTVIVDFSGVTFMDSTGIRFLVGFKTRCDSIGAAWRLENVSSSIIRLIELSGLNDFLQPTH